MTKGAPPKRKPARTGAQRTLKGKLKTAREWQVQQAWADAQAIAAGDRTFGSWDAIYRAAERARLRIREREAAKRQHHASS